MPATKTQPEIYAELFEIIAKAELAARNGQWMTCGTCGKQLTELAYKYGNEEKS